MTSKWLYATLPSGGHLWKDTLFPSLHSLYLSQLYYIHLYQGMSYLYNILNHNFTVVEKCLSELFFLLFWVTSLLSPQSVVSEWWWLLRKYQRFSVMKILYCLWVVPCLRVLVGYPDGCSSIIKLSLLWSKQRINYWCVWLEHLKKTPTNIIAEKGKEMDGLVIFNYVKENSSWALFNQRRIRGNMYRISELGYQEHFSP